MTGARALQIDAPHLALVRTILAARLPSGVTAWVFGSRVTGRAKPFSDLDIALEGEGPLPAGLIAVLAQAFDDSDLPWKVDVVDWSEVSAAFRAHVGEDRIRL